MNLFHKHDHCMEFQIGTLDSKLVCGCGDVARGMSDALRKDAAARPIWKVLMAVCLAIACSMLALYLSGSLPNVYN
jgi:hypothetical protein